MAVRAVKELTGYIKAYRVAMGFFEISKSFPEDVTIDAWASGEVPNASRLIPGEKNPFATSS